MINVFKDIKWLVSYMISIVMYSIIVVLVLVGIILAAYFVDFKIRDSRIQTPLYGAYVIVSGSMEPIIKVHDAVLTKRCNEEDIHIGDVVTYRSLEDAYYGILITHRVINIEEKNGEKLFITKGDHNETIDRSPVRFSQIQGKIIMRIPKIGYLKYFLVQNYGWITLIVIPSILIVVYDIAKLFKTSDDSKDKTKKTKGRTKGRMMALEK